MRLKIPTKPSIQLAEETGLHIGDGSMNYYVQRAQMKGKYSLRGHLVDDRNHYDTRIATMYRELYGIDVSNREMQSTGVYGFQVWNNELVAFKSKVLGLPLGWKTGVSIPAIFRDEEKFTIAVIRGVYDTDGNVYIENKRGKLYLRAKISNTSLKLALQIHTALNGLDIRATLHSQKRKNPHMERL